jgi:ribosomal protein S20
MAFAEKHIEIFYKVWTSLSEIPEERTKEIKASLFKDYIHKIPKMIKEGKNPEFYFTSYAQKYVECQTDGRRRNAKKIASRYAKHLTQELTPEMIEQFNKARMKSILHKKKTSKLKSIFI